MGIFTCGDCGGECDITPCKCCKPAAKTIAERVAKLRTDRNALSLKRVELYAHPEDWPAIKALAEKLQRRRAKLVAKRAG